ncbi:hypothetical protein Tco_0200960 [Tanacetum coccineum]
MDLSINDLQTRIDVTLLEDRKRIWMSDSQDSLREFYKTDVIPMSESLSMNFKALKQELIEENQDLLITISELKNKLKTVDKGKNVNTKFDKSKTSGTLLCVTPLPKNIKVKAKKVLNTKVNPDRSKPVTSHSIPKNEQSVESSNSVRRPKSKGTKSKDSILKNTNDKRPSAHVRKMSIICFLLSHEKYVARYALSRDSKVIQLFLWIVDSGCSKHMSGNLSLLRNFVKKFMGTLRFGNDHFAAITRYGDYGLTNPTDKPEQVEGFPLLTVSTRQIQEANDRDDLGKMKTKDDIVFDNSAANTLDNENTLSSSSIVVEEDEAPQIVSSSIEQVTSDPNTPVLNENADEFVQEDDAEFDKNVFCYPPQTSVFEEAESYSTY